MILSQVSECGVQLLRGPEHSMVILAAEGPLAQGPGIGRGRCLGMKIELLDPEQC